ncbi:MAG: phosphoribosylaminoimidazolecarboxamide formyltransferase [Epsilonproteobacteria bacterium]|nr:phosphoribosylaminoimidazolecarboxamide formyltransferase [Campylobacterota bacterium]
MLEPIINHQKEINEIFKKMQFLRDNFDFERAGVFLDELNSLALHIKDELEFHFNLQIYGIKNEKAKKFVMENMLVRDMLFRMLEYIILKSKEGSVDAFNKFEDFEEILRAYLKKEKGLFKTQLESVLSKEEKEEIKKDIEALV